MNTMNPYQNWSPYLNYGTTSSQVPQQRSVDDKIWVQGEGAARAYLVAPLGFVRLWDSTSPVFYEKRADQSGRPYMETYKYEKMETSQIPATQNESVTQMDLAIQEIKDRLTSIERRLSNEPADESISGMAGVSAVQTELPRKPERRSHETGANRKNQPATA